MALIRSGAITPSHRKDIPMADPQPTDTAPEAEPQAEPDPNGGLIEAEDENGNVFLVTEADAKARGLKARASARNKATQLPADAPPAEGEPPAEPKAKGASK